MGDYSLQLYQSAKGTTTPTHFADITERAQKWQRSINANGGAWEGSFRVEGSLHELQNWFYNRLGWHVIEVAGGITWAGMIYEMDLVYLGATRRRSLDDVYNYVFAHYTYSGEFDTAVAQEGWSVNHYGRKEQRLILEYFPQTAAENQRDLYLRQHAYPWPRPLTASATKGESYVDVTVLGYWKTMDWRLTSVRPATEDDVSVYIDSIVDADCADYLTVGAIRENTIQVMQDTDANDTAWTTLGRLVELGGNRAGTAYPWRLYVDNQRRVFYEEISTAPIYAIRDDGIYPYAGGQRLGPRQIVPGVMRDMRYPRVWAEPGSWLADARDTYVERVEVDADGKLRLSTLIYDPEEILMAQLSPKYEAEEAARQAADEAEAEAEARRNARGRQHWDDLTRKREDTDPHKPGWKWTGDEWKETDEPYM